MYYNYLPKTTIFSAFQNNSSKYLNIYTLKITYKPFEFPCNKKSLKYDIKFEISNNFSLFIRHKSQLALLSFGAVTCNLIQRLELIRVVPDEPQHVFCFTVL